MSSWCSLPPHDRPRWWGLLDSIAFHYLSWHHWARGDVVTHKNSQHRYFTSHLLWNKPPSAPLASGAVHYRGARLRGERARNLFDTFLCGCNCISRFPVVSFRKNAKALPIKPRAMLYGSTYSLCPSLCLAPLLPFLPPPLLLAQVCQQCVDKRDPDKFCHSSQSHASKSLSALKMFSKALLSVSKIFVSRYRPIKP